MSLAAILGAVGAGVNLLSPLFAREQQPEQINPQTEQRLSDLMAMVSQYEPQINALSGQAEAIRAQQAGVGQKAGDIAQQAEDLRPPSPNAWFDQYLANVPEYLNVAQEVSRRATETLGREIGEQMERDMGIAIRRAGDATAGQGFSGAAAAAAGGAAGQVLGQANLAREQAAADIFNQTTQNQLGQGQQLAYQDQQMQFQNALSQLQAALGGVGVQGQALGQQAAGVGQQQANLSSLLGAAQSGIQDITQPVYSSPSYVNPMGGAGNAIAAIGQFLGAAQNPWGGGGGLTADQQVAQLLGSNPAYQQLIEQNPNPGGLGR